MFLDTRCQMLILYILNSHILKISLFPEPPKIVLVIELVRSLREQFFSKTYMI